MSETSESPTEEELMDILKRRKSVSAKSYSPEKMESLKPFVYEKTSKQAKKLASDLKDILLFRHLSGEEIQTLVNVMKLNKIEKGQVIISAGSQCDNFFIIEDGMFEISTRKDEGETEVDQLLSSGNFGVKCLLGDSRQMETVLALTDGSVWSLNRHLCRQLMVSMDDANWKKKRFLLKKFELFQNLVEEDLRKLSDALVRTQLSKGNSIVNYGEPIEGIYFIRSGKVKITTPGLEEDDSMKTFVEGEHFGGINRSEQWANSIYAIEDVVLEFLNSETASRLVDISTSNSNH